MTDFFIGIDVGGTRTKYGLVDAGGVRRSEVLPTEKDEPTFLRQLCGVVESFRRAALQSGGGVAGLGIGVPGFTTEDGAVLTTYGAVPFMEAYPLVKKLNGLFPLPCATDNDARAVALGEAVHGAGRGHRRVLSLTLGTGVGFGFVVDGRFTDVAPFAHMGGNMTVTDEGGDCYCGKTGCLEALVSSSGILRLAQAQTGIPATLTVEDIFSEAATGYPAAVAVVQKVIGYLHTAVHNYANLFAPNVVVLGGGIAKGLLPYLNQIKGRSYMGPYPGYDFELALSALEESAGMLGAAALARSVVQTKTTSL